ncbi:MAG: hypothetical protein ACUVWP_05595 [bacterium]
MKKNMITRLNIIIILIFSINLILLNFTMAEIHLRPSLEFGYIPTITILGVGRFNFEINPYIRPGFNVKLGFAFFAIGLFAGPDIEIYFRNENKPLLNPFIHTSIEYVFGTSMGGNFHGLIIHTSFGVDIGAHRKSIIPFIEFGQVIYPGMHSYEDIIPIIIQGGLRF